MRADQLLLQRELATSRAQAQRLIASGVQWRADVAEGAASVAPWKRIAKNSDDVPVSAQIELLDASEARFVSRGGLKLEGALKRTGLKVDGKMCLDVGQSSGGFTDCLLAAGARFVVGVDVGSGQLHPSMREHSRVLAIEHVNARELDASVIIANFATNTRAGAEFDDELSGSVSGIEESDIASDISSGADFDARFDLVVGDLSFISQTLVLPALVPLLNEGGEVLFLVKPQFELQPGQVGKGGIVKAPTMYAVVEERVRACYTSLGLTVVAWFESTITGGDGNREFFIHARLDPKP